MEKLSADAAQREALAMEQCMDYVLITSEEEYADALRKIASMQRLLAKVDDERLLRTLSDTLLHRYAPIDEALSQELQQETLERRIDAGFYVIELVNVMPLLDTKRAFKLFENMLSSHRWPRLLPITAVGALPNFAYTDLEGSLPLWQLALEHSDVEVRDWAHAAKDELTDPQLTSLPAELASRLHHLLP